MINTQFDLHEDSLEIGANIPVTFVRCAYKHGKSFKTKEPWHSLDFIFHDKTNDKYLVHKSFQPPRDKYFVQREYSVLLSEILNSLGNENLWSQIKASRQSWEVFYTNYLTLIDRFRKKDVYIKTVACPHWKEREKFVACLAEKNFISTKPNLEYTYLERNEVEDFLNQSKDVKDDNISSFSRGSDPRVSESDDFSTQRTKKQRIEF